MKRLLTGFLALTLALPWVGALADDGSSNSNRMTGAPSNPDTTALANAAAIYLPETPGHVAGTVVVKEIPEGGIEDAVKKVKEAGAGDQLFVFAGPGDDFRDPNPDNVARVDRGARIQQLRARINEHSQVKFIKAIEALEHNQRRVALIVAISAGYAYGTYYFIMTHSWIGAVGTGVEGATIFALLGLLSKKWLRFSKYGVGNPLAAAAKIIFSEFELWGMKIPDRALVAARRLGQVAAAYGLNLVSTTAMMATAGQLQHNWAAGTTIALSSVTANAAYSSHDLLDFPAERKFGSEKSPVFVPIRVALCMALLEIPAFMGNTWAEWLSLGVLGVASTLFIFREPVRMAVKGARKTARDYFERLKSKVANSVSGRFYTKKNCEQSLISQGNENE